MDQDLILHAIKRTYTEPIFTLKYCYHLRSLPFNFPFVFVIKAIGLIPSTSGKEGRRAEKEGRRAEWGRGEVKDRNTLNIKKNILIIYK